MARTKASVGAKISSGKSSKARCSVAPTTSTGTATGSSDKAARSAGGGNPVCPRETPNWQRPITNFFINKHNDSKGSDTEDGTTGEAAGSSKTKRKRNIIESSDEGTSPEKPKNTALDETIELESLTGENSHKIEEYYPKGAKGKGIGKKTKTKEDSNGVSGTEDRIKTNEKLKDVDNLEDEEMSSKLNGKENIDSNIEMNKSEKEDVSDDKDSNIKERSSKREREDRLEEEGNVCKRIKVK